MKTKLQCEYIKMQSYEDSATVSRMIPWIMKILTTNVSDKNPVTQSSTSKPFMVLLQNPQIGYCFMTILSWKTSENSLIKDLEVISISWESSK